MAYKTEISVKLLKGIKVLHNENLVAVLVYYEKTVKLSAYKLSA